jgi:hypothetical protein
LVWRQLYSWCEDVDEATNQFIVKMVQEKGGLAKLSHRIFGSETPCSCKHGYDLPEYTSACCEWPPLIDLQQTLICAELEYDVKCNWGCNRPIDLVMKQRSEWMMSDNNFLCGFLAGFLPAYGKVYSTLRVVSAYGAVVSRDHADTSIPTWCIVVDYYYSPCEKLCWSNCAHHETSEPHFNTSRTHLHANSIICLRF